MARARSAAFVVALGGTCLAIAACGEEPQPAEPAAGGGELAAISDYLTAHSADLAEQTEVMRAEGERYYELAESVDFDYRALMRDHGDEVEALLERSKNAFSAANPAYEEMEGIVAGVPSLAQYDVDIDAGSDASDPENAVSFSLELPDGEVLKQPGNAFFVTETALYGTNPDFLADGVAQDLDRDGREEFGEGIPDANVYVAMVRKFDELADQLDADAQEFQPTPSDAFTAVTVMTPTMSEYFEAWKNSRFVAGEKATETAFVDRSRLADIVDILEGVAFTYDEIEPMIAEEAPQQAGQTERELRGLLAYVEDLRDREANGEKYTAEEADTLGSEAQRRAEAIAGQVTQAAQRLGVELQDA